MTTGELIGSGRTADVFALDGDWVLRRYRDAVDASPEAALMRRLAARGYPVPEVRPGTYAKGDLVMRRVTGPTMSRAMLDGSLEVAEAAALLADLLHRLHTLPVTDTVPGHRQLHLDLHPENVLLGPRGPVVIDWQNAATGPPSLDWALSALIMAQVAVSLTERTGAVEEFLRLLLAAGPSGIASQLPRARRRRARDPMARPEELTALDAAVDRVVAALPSGADGYDPGRHAQ
ncbi:phosphotransferase [Streptomyces sp. NPDC007088]|uniref:phosphotransferase n=1 Tax=Streptomyces sp. NPDC007088 TaxID=3364773 RepID=UPI0036C81B08